MSLKNKSRSNLNNFLWYCSGLNIRDLAEPTSSKSNFFGLGGVNIFVTLFFTLITAISFHIAFPKIGMFVYILLGIVTGMLIFFFIRHTISAISIHDHAGTRKNWQFVTILPLVLFSIFYAVITTTPIKFYLFDIPDSIKLLDRLKEFDKFSDSNINATISSWSLTVFAILLLLLPIFIKIYTRSAGSEKNRSNLLNEFMWFCAGAHKEALRKCPTDHSKFFGIGGTILFTALLATLSGGYAFYTAFNSTSLAIGFGLIWGSMIFNLDRYIVNTIYTDGTVKITKGELLAATPRLIIAIILGIVISLPLELKLFEDEINSRIETMKVDNLKIYRGKLNNSFSSINIDKKEVTDLESKRDALKIETEEARKDWESVKRVKKMVRNEDGDLVAIYIWPPEYYSKKKLYEEVKLRNDQDINDLKSRINTNLEKIKSGETVMAGYDKANDKKNIALDDLSTRMESFDLLKAEKPSIRIASIFIMLLLIIIEIAPVLFKLMTESGPYDDLLNTIKHETKVRELKRISDLNDQINTEIQLSSEKNRNQILAELQTNEELLKSIAHAQAEVAYRAIEIWKEREMKKVIDDPEYLIQSKSINNA